MMMRPAELLLVTHDWGSRSWILSSINYFHKHLLKFLNWFFHIVQNEVPTIIHSHQNHYSQLLKDSLISRTISHSSCPDRPPPSRSLQVSTSFQFPENSFLSDQLQIASFRSFPVPFVANNKQKKTAQLNLHLRLRKIKTN